MDPKKQTSEEKQQTLATTKAMKELKAHLKEMRQNNTGKSGVQGKEFNRKSIENMGPVSNKDFKDFKPDDPKGIPGALFGVASDKVKDVGSTLLSATGLGGALGYMKTRNNIKRANKKHEDERQKIKDMLATAGKANTVGLEKLIAAFTKSYSKGKNSGVKPFDALIDTLINMGATTESEIESLLETFSGGNYDPDALNNAIDAEVTGGGFGTKGSMLSKKLGGSSPSLSPSPVSNDAPFSYNPSSPLGGGPKKNSSSSPDERQIKLLTSILDVLDTRIPKPDKLQKKENRLEERRRKGREGGPVGAGEGEGGDGGEGGGGILDTLMDLAMLSGGGKGGRRRKGAKARARRMRGGRGKLGMLRRLGGFVGRNAGKVGALGAAAATGVAGAAGGLGGGIGSALSSAGSAVASGGSAVGGWLSNAASWVGSTAKSAAGKVGTLAKYVNPMAAIKSSAPKLLKVVAKKIPIIGSAFETFFAGQEISEIKADATLSNKEKKQKIGKVIGGAMGSILGMVGAGALTSPLIALGGPIGLAGTVLASIAGAEAGRWLGGKAAGWIGAESIYDLFSSIPVIGNMLNLGDDAEGDGSLTANTASLGSGGGATSTTTNTAALVPNTSTPTLTNTTPSTIQSSQSNAAARSGSGGGNTIVAPSSSVDNSVVTTSNTNISSNPVGQGEASFVAAQYSNGSQRF